MDIYDYTIELTHVLETGLLGRKTKNKQMKYPKQTNKQTKQTNKTKTKPTKNHHPQKPHFIRAFTQWYIPEKDLVQLTLSLQGQHWSDHKPSSFTKTDLMKSLGISPHNWMEWGKPENQTSARPRRPQDFFDLTKGTICLPVKHLKERKQRPLNISSSE